MILRARKKRAFILISLLMALTIMCISSIHREAVASMMASKLSEGAGKQISSEDLRTIQVFLESRIVVQKLSDFGMSKKEAMEKVRQLDEKDLHVLAGMVRVAPSGGDGVGVLIGLAVLALLVILIIKLMDKEIIIK